MRGSACAKTAVEFGEQRIYASHHSIMFARTSCYFFVRPKKNFLEVCIFLGRALKGPQVKRTDEASKSKVANILRITHRDEVEPPVTDWLREGVRILQHEEGSEGADTRRQESKAAISVRRLIQIEIFVCRYGTL